MVKREHMRRTGPSAANVGTWIFAGAMAIALMLGCSSSTPASAGGDASTAGDAAGVDAAPASLTWHHDVRPIVESKCGGCHVSGGFAPFALQSYADVKAHLSRVAAAVDGKIMPPWPPNDSCNSYVNDRSLSDAQRSTIVSWARGSAAEGDPATYVPPPKSTVTPMRVDKTLTMDTAYAPVQTPDEYRCFVMDFGEATTKYVTGINVRPGATPIVHHVIAFLVTPADVATVQALDAADPAPGYSCFGGVGVNSVGWLGAWVPGTIAQPMPDASGIKVPAGSKVVLQMHYNTANSPAAPDRSSLDMQLADSVATEGVVLKFTNPSWVKSHTMNIASGDPDSVQKFAIDPTPYMSIISNNVLASNQSFKVWASALHMHSRGVKATLSVVHPDGSSSCALQIDDWNFHWQGSYGLTAPMTVQPGDQLSIECHFDNSGSRQPLVGGRPLPVGPVNWGETTEDEMCLGTFYATQN